MYKIVKRMLDLILSLLAAAVLSPVLAVISVAVKLDSKGPILFSQKRIGANKQIFMMHKFRTMKIDTPHDT
ncbi:MAG: sugar transferase, partial [Clostridiales bacterium]|nr:sugar transferase [Clostridiales bacterium]